MNKRIRKFCLPLLLAVGALGSAACGVRTPMMISNIPLGDRIVRFGIPTYAVGSNNYSLLLEVCSVDPNGQPANCRRATPLENVGGYSVDSMPLR
jgi:hypothetical protein